MRRRREPHGRQGYADGRGHTGGNGCEEVRGGQWDQEEGRQRDEEPWREQVRGHLEKAWGGGRGHPDRCREPDRGSATVWSLGAIAVLLAVFGGVLALGHAVVVRHRAAGGADLAALAAADHWAEGGTAACARAERVTAAQGARLVRCVILGETSDVSVATGRGPFTAEIRARAGPAGPVDPESPAVPDEAQGVCAGCRGERSQADPSPAVPVPGGSNAEPSVVPGGRRAEPPPVPVPVPVLVGPEAEPPGASGGPQAEPPGASGVRRAEPSAVPVQGGFQPLSSAVRSGRQAWPSAALEGHRVSPVGRAERPGH